MNKPLTSTKDKKEIVIPILNSEYKVVVCFGSPKEVAKIMKKWGLDEDVVLTGMTDRRGACFYKIGCHPIIAMPSFPKRAEEIGTLSHEAVHAVGHIFRMIEQDSAEEVFAHSVGAIVRGVLSKSLKRITKTEC